MLESSARAWSSCIFPGSQQATSSATATHLRGAAKARTARRIGHKTPPTASSEPLVGGRVLWGLSCHYHAQREALNSTPEELNTLTLRGTLESQSVSVRFPVAC